MLVETIVNQFSFNTAAGKRGQDHSGQLLQTRHQGYSAFHLLVNNDEQRKKYVYDKGGLYPKPWGVRGVPETGYSKPSPRKPDFPSYIRSF